ncbi:TPA: acyltransferase, partial [Morganella morganii]|nr:acyltransferase [Morganella morganii]
MQKTYFRKDINGLRALAVLSVVIFHFNRDYLPGGFIGVDIFFVISGFLMTSIIFRGLLNNNFSYTQFLYSRVKRIIPALMCIISILILFGFLFLEPMSYLSLGKHSFYSLLFSSNIVYWLESGYFDVNSNNKFLLHTWSLSVEWQFYMIYPLVL